MLQSIFQGRHPDEQTSPKDRGNFRKNRKKVPSILTPRCPIFVGMPHLKNFLKSTLGEYLIFFMRHLVLSFILRFKKQAFSYPPVLLPPPPVPPVEGGVLYNPFQFDCKVNYGNIEMKFPWTVHTDGWQFKRDICWKA